MPLGLFISFEGIDGAGKSTHIQTLAAALRAKGRTVTTSREPGGTPLAEALRDMVLHTPMDPLTEALLVFAARRDHVTQVIAPALSRGEVVLCDRFTDASFAYQGAGRGFDTAVLAALEGWVQAGQGATGGMLQPDVTLWFDVEPAQAAARLAQSRTPDRFEAEPVLFFERVRRGYEQRWHAHPDRLVRIDAAPAPDEVWLSILESLTSRGYL